MMLKKSKPRHRPVDVERRAAIHRALDVASEQMTMDRGDLTYLLAENRRVFEIQEADERAAQAIDWTIDHADSLRKLEQREVFEVAAKLFNRSLEKAKSIGERLSERPGTKAIMRNEHYRRKNRKADF